VEIDRLAAFKCDELIGDAGAIFNFIFQDLPHFSLTEILERACGIVRTV
jgi:hypothetical protein